MTGTPTEDGLEALLAAAVRRGEVTGAVGLIARGGDEAGAGAVETAAVGSRTDGGPEDIAPDTVFRIASVSKIVTAAAVMLLVDEGRFGLDDPVERWLPELAAPRVVRVPEAPVDDLVPAHRPITVRDLLTARAGWGYPDDFSLPAARALAGGLRQTPPLPDGVPAPDEWLADLAKIPLLAQPGERFLYNTTSDIQGVLVARAAGRPFAEFLTERLFAPLGMADTAFSVPKDRVDRLTGLHRRKESGELLLWDAPDGMWSHEPAFPSGAGGLVSTAGDLHAFLRMLLADGRAPDGRALLTPGAVSLMRTDHLTADQRAGGAAFLDGQGWGFGGAVDVDPVEPWNTPGRYGWIGGTGTSAHLVPSTATISILLTTVALSGPSAPPLLQEFWQYAAAR
ncbi:serine hydrolase domain-containing protein [Streptomyces sp. NPDC058953]|uniref:serine hydrolase domain-containing protein n=1 Tax=unclassified Streptomyces TaxID=2593676 RepID=UPI0036A08B96